MLVTGYNSNTGYWSVTTPTGRLLYIYYPIYSPAPTPQDEDDFGLLLDNGVQAETSEI